MTTEKDITDLAARLKAAYTGGYTSINMTIDNHTTGRTKVSYWAYMRKPGEPSSLGPEFSAFHDLQAWLEANWLNKEHQ